MAQRPQTEQGAPRPRQLTVAERKERQRPWFPKHWEIADAAAVQAVAYGTATDEQQKRAMKFIVETLCGRMDLPYRSGEDGDRDTAFACGMVHVGHQVSKFVTMDIGKLRRGENSDLHEPS